MKCPSNPQEEILHVPIAERHSLDDLDLVVDPFDYSGGNGIPGKGKDAGQM